MAPFIRAARYRGKTTETHAGGVGPGVGPLRRISAEALINRFPVYISGRIIVAHQEDYLKVLSLIVIPEL